MSDRDLEFCDICHEPVELDERWRKRPDEFVHWRCDEQRKRMVSERGAPTGKRLNTMTLCEETRRCSAG